MNRKSLELAHLGCFLLNEGVTAINNLLVILIKKKRAKTQIHKTRNVKEK